MPKHRFMRDNFRVKSYHRWENESKKQYKAFVDWRTMNPEDRNLTDLAKEQNYKLKDLGNWSLDFDWHRRAEDFDEEADRQLRWANFRKIEEMTKNQAMLGKMCQSLGLKELKKTMAIADADPANCTMSPSMLLKFIQVGSSLERVARGEPTEIVKAQEKVEKTDLSRLSVDELVQLEALKAKAQADPEGGSAE